MAVGSNVTLRPVDGETEFSNSTVPVNPYRGETVIVDELVEPAERLTRSGLAIRTKSGDREAEVCMIAIGVRKSIRPAEKRISPENTRNTRLCGRGIALKIGNLPLRMDRGFSFDDNCF